MKWKRSKCVEYAHAYRNLKSFKTIESLNVAHVGLHTATTQQGYLHIS